MVFSTAMLLHGSTVTSILDIFLSVQFVKKQWGVKHQRHENRGAERVRCG